MIKNYYADKSSFRYSKKKIKNLEVSKIRAHALRNVSVSLNACLL